MHKLGQTFVRLRALFGTERRWRWVLLVILALVVTVVEVIGAGLIFVLLGLVTSPGQPITLPVIGPVQDLFPGTTDREVLLAAAVTVGGFFVLRFFLLVGRAYVQHRLVNNAGALLADKLLRTYLALPYLEHTRRSSPTLVRNVFDTTQNVIRQALRPVVDIVAESLVVVGLAAVLVATSPRALGLAVLVLAPTVLILQRVIQPRLKGHGRELQDARVAALAAIQQALGGVRDIKLLRREASFADRHLRERLRSSRATYVARTLSVVPRAMIETSLVLTIVIVLVAALLTGTTVQEVVPTLGLFAYVGLRLQPSLQKIVEGLNELEFSSAAIDDLVVDLSGDPVTGPATSTPPDGRADLVRQIDLEAVSFTYAAGSRAALQDANLTIRRGEFVGICGPTGGGKSTLVDLLIGLLEPTTGRVMVDGVELGREPAWWWQQIGVVSQEIFLVDGTVIENIAFGEPTGEIDRERLWAAVRRAQLDEMVDRLPNGLDTRVGERGVKLSGGQRQRIAIARALYRRPAVLVFDEGTSALDGATEAALVAAIDEVQHGRTLVAVAHRISTLRHADRILVVADGRIDQVGTYDELLERSDLFRRLAR